jgi:hypothetical protein
LTNPLSREQALGGSNGQQRLSGPMALFADHTRWFRVPDGGSGRKLNVRYRSAMRIFGADKKNRQ